MFFLVDKSAFFGKTYTSISTKIVKFNITTYLFNTKTICYDSSRINFKRGDIKI